MYSFATDTASIGSTALTAGGSTQLTAGGLASPPRRRRSAAQPQPSRSDRGKWDVITTLRHFRRRDVDEYRTKYGKVEGEAKFFFDNQPDDIQQIPGNMVMANGVCACGSMPWATAAHRRTTRFRAARRT